MKSLKIGAHVYRIERDSVDLAEECDWASHDGRRRVIHVETRERPGSAVAEDIIHEIMHAMFLDSGVEIERDDEERVCTVLAPRLAAFFATNEDVVQELLDMLGGR